MVDVEKVLNKLGIKFDYFTAIYETEKSEVFFFDTIQTYTTNEEKNNKIEFVTKKRKETIRIEHYLSAKDKDHIYIEGHDRGMSCEMDQEWFEKSLLNFLKDNTWKQTEWNLFTC